MNSPTLRSGVIVVWRAQPGPAPAADITRHTRRDASVTFNVTRSVNMKVEPEAKNMVFQSK